MKVKHSTKRIKQTRLKKQSNVKLRLKRQVNARPRLKIQSNLKNSIITNFPNSNFINRVETPLDVLYNSIEEDGLSIHKIMKKFDLKKEQALEWCEVLVNRDLAELEYPVFGEPVLRIKRE